MSSSAIYIATFSTTQISVVDDGSGDPVTVRSDLVTSATEDTDRTLSGNGTGLVAIDDALDMGTNDAMAEGLVDGVDVSASVSFDDLSGSGMPIGTSDDRMRNTISPLPSELGLVFISSLNPITYKWNTTNSGNGESEVIHARTHLGLSAQEVKMSIEAAGRTLQTTDIMDNDYLVDPSKEDRYAIRYHALIPSLIASIKELKKHNEALEARLDALELFS